MSVIISKWGNDLGLRIPKAVVEQLNLKKRNDIRVTVQDGSIILTPEKNKIHIRRNGAENGKSKDAGRG